MSRRYSFSISKASAKLHKKLYRMELRKEWSKNTCTKKQTSVYILSSQKSVQGFHQVFVKGVSGVFQLGIFSFSYERKLEDENNQAN